MKKNIFVYFLAFFILFALANPFYIKKSVYECFYKNAYKNDTADVYIYNTDKKNIKIKNNSKDIAIQTTDICHKKERKNCVLIQLPLTKNWEKYEISINLEGNKKSKIRISEPLTYKNNKVYYMPVDFKHMNLNLSVTNLCHLACEELGANFIPAGAGNSIKQLDTLETLKTEYCFSTPNYLIKITDRCGIAFRIIK